MTTTATATATAAPADVRSPSTGERVRSSILGLWAAVTGAAPHVLHHVGPLAGSALVAGAGGQVVFGAIGFVATVPTLRRLRRRTGGWRAPGLALAAFAAVFAFSMLVIGPAVASNETTTAVTGVSDDTVDHHGHTVDEGNDREVAP